MISLWRSFNPRRSKVWFGKIGRNRIAPDEYNLSTGRIEISRTSEKDGNSDGDQEQEKLYQEK